VNADLIAAGLSPLAPEQQLFTASQLFLQQIEHHITEGRDFAFETTFSGRGYLRLVQRLRSARWRVELFYLALPNVELSQQRVAERVAHGGHSIAPADILRRFPRSLRNLLDVYAGAVDDAFCLLNSGPSPEVVFVQQGETRTIVLQPVYEDLVKAAMP
jgi:predicted ABC-type ATPase